MVKKPLLLLVAIVLFITFTMVPGCRQDDVSDKIPELPSATYTIISVQIADIDISRSASLSALLNTAQGITRNTSDGTISGQEADNLKAELGQKFSAWIKDRVDGIDPAKPESIKDFFDLQAVQGTSEYEEYTDPQKKQYKEEQMKEKFNEWVRNRVDEIDPTNPDDIRKFFWMQNIQATGKYDELATADIRQYKETQMSEKFNEWVRNRVDEIDPTNPDNLKYFFWMQNIQGTEKYEEFATPETHDYKENQMRQRFNDWVENLVNGLDPNDPDFLKNLEMLRNLQLSDKYDKYINADMHQWKEQTLQDKMATYVTNLLNGLHPLSPTLWADLAILTKFQLRDVYKELCPSAIKQEKQARLTGILTRPPGQPPEVAGTYPVMGQVEVSLDQPIMIAFNQPMDPGSLASAIEVSPATMFTSVPMDEENFIIVLLPREFLAQDTAYIVTINQAAISLAGSSLLETYEFSFKTKSAGAAPSVKSTMPLNGTIDNMAGQPIVIKFDQKMDTGSVEATLSITPKFEYGVIWDAGDTTAIIQSHVPLDVNTVYTVTVGGGATSADGVPIIGEHQFRFITGINGPPVVLGTMPDNGQSDIPPNHPIRIVFDRPMDRRSVESMMSFSSDFEHSTRWYEANMVLEIIPMKSLAINTTYTITIKAGALSSVGLPLGDDFGFSFATAD